MAAGDPFCAGEFQNEIAVKSGELAGGVEIHEWR
jgi:hypothetical protein